LKGLTYEPENAIVLYNTAYVYNQKGDKANAKKYYELTVKHCTDKEEKLKEVAKKRLEELK
jgi:Tfp pilus assembly protein PilF